jgi:copper chaperone CopZ
MPLLFFMAEKKVTLMIEGMHCGHCAAGIAEGLKKLKGVTGADVLFTTGKAKITYDPDAVKADALVKVVTDLGYTVKGIKE